MPVIAATAPVRLKHSRFDITEVRLSASGLVSVVSVSDSAGTVVAVLDLVTNATRWQGISYSAQNEVQLFTADTPGGPGAALAADFTAFAGTSGGFAPKSAALETRLQATGRLPA
jgi:hypothetical protein